MARFSLHTVGRDQPGIVAKVTQVLAELGANLEESNMTILHDQSAIMLVLEVPGLSDGRRIEGALEHVAEEFNLFVTVAPMPDGPRVTIDGDTYLVVVEGADRTGIVAGVSAALAGIGASIIDLISRPIEIAGSPGFALRLSLTLPRGTSKAELEAALEATDRTLGVTHTVRSWSGELAWDATTL